MGKFYNQNKDSQLQFLEQELKKIREEALKDPSRTEDFVRVLGLIMNKTNGVTPTQEHIDFVTARLLNDPNPPSIRTGNGKSIGLMLLAAAEGLLKNKTVELVGAVQERNLNQFQTFFNILKVNVALKSTNDITSENVNSIVIDESEADDLRERNPKQIEGRSARSSERVPERDPRQIEGRSARNNDLKKQLHESKDNNANDSSQATPSPK